MKDIAKAKNLHVVSLPKYFEVRWTQFLLQLLTAILSSWNALVLYFEQSNETGADGHYNFLTEKDNLELLSFLADCLETFSRFQQNLQRDSTTLVDMMRYVNQVSTKIGSLIQNPLSGGWVSAFNEQIEILSEERFRLNGIELRIPRRRDPAAVKNEITLSLCNFLEARFQDDREIVDIFDKFMSFDRSVNLRNIHECIASDLDLASLDLEYSEVIDLGFSETLKKLSLIEMIQMFIRLGNYPILTTIFARIAAAKPHSADVERLISCNNILKTEKRSLLSIQTENLYLYVYFNMPPLESWDPRPAITKWIKMKDRRTRDHSKAKEQSWYTGIFEEAKTHAKAEENRATQQSAPKIKRF